MNPTLSVLFNFVIIVLMQMNFLFSLLAINIYCETHIHIGPGPKIEREWRKNVVKVGEEKKRYKFLT